ncbi:MAG: hypothetical protein J5615_01585 [Fibrobacter sp.]|nr:hypothetical protein [Fibrobacter sp.]
MRETLTTFFVSDGWTFVCVVVLTVFSVLLPYLYFELEGMMSTKTFLTLCAIEVIICSTSGFGDLLEMSKNGCVAASCLFICGLFIYSLFTDGVKDS